MKKITLGLRVFCTILLTIFAITLTHSQNQDINIPESGNLGNAPIGVPTDYTLTLENAYSGGSPQNNKLTVSGWTISGTNASEFSVSGISFPVIINRAASVPFTISFTPTTSGVRTATLEITSDDPDENPYYFNLSGNGDPSLITGLTLLNSYPVSVLEPSGLAFDKVNNRLFTVSDNTGQVMILSTTGTLIQTLAYIGSDLEGVSMYKTNKILIAVEGTMDLVEYDYVNDITVTTHSMSYANYSTDTNSRIEGVTYDATNDEIYFVSEKNPGLLLKADGNFNVTNEYTEPLNHGGDYSGTYYVEETGELWIVSDQTSSAYRCNTDGTVIQSFLLTTSGGAALDKAEGIAIDYANSLLYAIADGGEELYVYQINYPSTCPDPIPEEPTAVNCWDNYQFNTTSCVWENMGTEPTNPGNVNCWDDFQLDTNTCTYVNMGTEPTNPGNVNCWDDFQFNTTSCAWENQGSQPTAPTNLECWETTAFNDTTCAWDITNNGDTVNPICSVQDITVQLSFGSATITVNDIDNGSYDDCAINSIVLSQYNFDSNDIGQNVVTLTITDNSGNSSSCDAIVTVEDETLGHEEWNIDSIEVYPNPFKNSITINTNSSDLFAIQIFDINGRLILSKEKVTPINNKILIGNLDVQQGSYLLRITNLESKSFSVKKLLKY